MPRGIIVVQHFCVAGKTECNPRARRQHNGKRLEWGVCGLRRELVREMYHTVVTWLCTIVGRL